jgi:cytochrome c-type biogenesis protein CcmH
MNAIIFGSTFFMLLTAMSFASAPLLRNAGNSPRGFVHVPLLAVLATLLLAIGLYAAIGRPDVAISDKQDNASPPASVSNQANQRKSKAASVNSLLAGLEQQLRDDPGDATGWLLLAKSYDHLGRTSDAAAAYDRATELGKSDNDLEARLK